MGADHTTRPDHATVAKAAGEDRLPEIAEHSVTTASAFAVSSGEAGSARPGKKDTTNAGVTAVARLAGVARPLEIPKTESDVAVSSGEAGLSWPRVERTPSASITAVAVPAGRSSSWNRKAE